MNLKKTLSVLLIFSFNILHAQKSELEDRYFFGGNLGASFGSVTYVDLNPIVGYLLSEKTQIGVSGTFQYINDKRYVPAYESSLYGGSLFGRLFLTQDFFAHSEFQMLNVEERDFFSISKDRVWIPMLLVGGGYFSRIGANSGLQVSILYDVIQDPNSPYAKIPLMKIGFVSGF